jgi:hypothetical protein
MRSQSVAAAASSAIGAGAVGLAGGGGEANNILLGDTTTILTAANLSINGDIKLDSNNSQNAYAGIGAGVFAGTVGSGGAIAVGAVKVMNLLGVLSADPSDSYRAKVQTSIVDSNLWSTGLNTLIPILPSVVRRRLAMVPKPFLLASP